MLCHVLQLPLLFHAGYCLPCTHRLPLIRILESNLRDVHYAYPASRRCGTVNAVQAKITFRPRHRVYFTYCTATTTDSKQHLHLIFHIALPTHRFQARIYFHSSLRYILFNLRHIYSGSGVLSASYQLQFDLGSDRHSTP